jgi:hypothetical protein
MTVPSPAKRVLLEPLAFNIARVSDSKNPQGQRVLVQYDEATNIGMIRRNPSCHPHASQIQPRHSLQLTQRMNALHDAIQDQTHHQAWRVRSAPGGSIALLER